MEITIREARVEDSHGIASILHALGWSEKINKEPFIDTQTHVAQRIERCAREQTHTILVAVSVDDEMTGSIIGYSAVHWFPHLMLGNDGYVSELFVHPRATGQGIGSRLLDVVKAEAQERGCTRLLLMNRRIRESYARKFYTKRGWEEMGDAAFFSFSLPQPEGVEWNDRISTLGRNDNRV
jgi:GNAT superfamily N-acetyltransferase